MKKYIFSIMFLALAVFALYFYIVGIKQVRTWAATKDGTTYISKMYGDYSILGKSCQGEDTDGDSYVSCDFRIANQKNEERVLHLQCPTLRKSFTGSVCKEYRFAIPSTN